MGKKDLNLLPLEVLNRRRAKQRTRMMSLLLIFTILACLLGVQTLFIKKNSLENKKTDIIRQINGFNEVSALEKTLTTEKQSVASFQEVLNTAGNSPELYRDALDRLEKDMPEDVFILEMSLTGEKISAKCAASKEMVVADLIRKLKDSGMFADVFVSEITNSQKDVTAKNQDNVNFNISCTIQVQKGNTK